ncbi:hypothetical protein BD289DRAFT_101463 [Coniella lustricola]|uniref:Uncharacterized protein n=1 Tax=Coniella lustricola TaxID=2025994 RepID=A0A2T3AGR7_9PEZI|nr:hypothetical protein BD289DRAFT_101463 [Coniella lustricola]
MSASAAARQRLDDLLAQDRLYREKLQAQEDELRRLQSLVLQTRTVVEFTLPTEMQRARQEYMSTVDKCQAGNLLKQEYGTTAQILREKFLQRTSCLFSSSNGGNSSDADADYDHNGLVNYFERFSSWGWIQIVIVLVSLAVAGLLSRKTSQASPY